MYKVFNVIIIFLFLFCCSKYENYEVEAIQDITSEYLIKDGRRFL